MIMRLPIADALARGREASQWTFVTNMQSRADAASRSRLDAEMAGYAELDKAQDIRMEDLQKALATVQSLLQLQTEATDKLRDMTQSESDETQKWQTKVDTFNQKQTAALLTVQQALAADIEKLLGRLNGWLDRARGSAGGMIGAGQKAREELPKGYPWATGDIRWSCNNAVNGWLCCNGRVLPASVYPELAYVLGDAFGTAATGYFQLPTKAQLAPTAFVLASDLMQAWIRT